MKIPREMSSYHSSDKILPQADLLSRIAAWRVKHARIVFTNGCFDLMHPGHVQYLETARGLGDYLVVGLNTDRSVRELKGPSRPILDEAGRARVLAALEAVSAVVLFDEDTPLELIKSIRPDFLVKGADYTVETVVGAPEVLAYGGQVELIPFVEGYSTSGIIQKIKDESP